MLQLVEDVSSLNFQDPLYHNCHNNVLLCTNSLSNESCRKTVPTYDLVQKLIAYLRDIANPQGHLGTLNSLVGQVICNGAPGGAK